MQTRVTETPQPRELAYLRSLSLRSRTAAKTECTHRSQPLSAVASKTPSVVCKLPNCPDCAALSGGVRVPIAPAAVRVGHHRAVALRQDGSKYRRSQHQHEHRVEDAFIDQPLAVWIEGIEPHERRCKRRGHMRQGERPDGQARGWRVLEGSPSAFRSPALADDDRQEDRAGQPEILDEASDEDTGIDEKASHHKEEGDEQSVRKESEFLFRRSVLSRLVEREPGEKRSDDVWKLDD